MAETPVDNGDLLERISKIRSDPWEFCRQCVFTLDQTDKKQPIKPFPSDLLYLKLYIRIWQKERFVAVPKSRRMFMSWINIALHLWDALFYRGKAIGIVSKKEDDADELIKKAKFIYDNIPELIIPKALLPRAEYTFNKLKFPEIDSILMGFPQGADQLRQFTFSRILADEMAFWDDAAKMYSASVPTLEGSDGGCLTAISSPAPGFFKDLVFDRLDGSQDPIDHVNDQVNRYPIEGVEVWRNPKNKFFVFQLHYTANPNKREPGYIDKVRSAMPVRQFKQEYDLQWESFSGSPVYLDWNPVIHGTKDEIDPELGLPILLGFDFGLTPACVVCQLQDEKLVVMREITAINMGAQRFARKVKQVLSMEYPSWSDYKRDFKVYVDPSGFFRKDTDEGTCAQILAKEGFDCIAGAVDWESRRSSVEHFLTKQNKNGSCFVVSLGKTPILTRGFGGGYRYSDRSFDIEPSGIRPIKDEHSHIHDALQMVTSGLVRSRKRSVTEIPKPMYSWAHKAGSLDQLTRKFTNGRKA